MADTIRGPVTSVVDGDTFDMSVQFYGNDNEYKYNLTERVRIADIDAPELNTLAGKRSKEHLTKALLGKQVRCYIQSRDVYQRVVAAVRLV